jgi:hypothetical protein
VLLLPLLSRKPPIPAEASGTVASASPSAEAIFLICAGAPHHCNGGCLSFRSSPGRQVNHDSTLFGNCSNAFDSRHACGPFARCVKGGEHAIQAAAGYRENEQARCNRANIAVGTPSVARSKEKFAGAEMQWIGRAFDPDSHVAAQQIEGFVHRYGCVAARRVRM